MARKEKTENYKSDLPCISCGLEGENQTCWHHLKTRGSGGSDDGQNLISTCFRCHANYHQKGTEWMANKYPSVKEWLLKNDWWFEEYATKWKHKE